MVSKSALLAISTDIVLFSIHHERLEVLLIGQDDGKWRLPGGLIAPDEDLDRSALRYLQEQTGVRGVYLEQLYTFGRPDRDPRQRVVSVAYYALEPAHHLDLSTAVGTPALCWFEVNALPPLALDHPEVIAMAHRRLAAKLAYSTIALQLLPERFTLSALQAVYQTILGAALDKRNFRKRMLAMDCIEVTGELCREGNHRPARLYRVKKPGTVEFIK